MYRIFGCLGGAYNDDVIGALTQAHADGVDVVDMSFGYAAALQNLDPFNELTSGLAAAGIAVIAAAGNDGQSGAFNPAA